MKYKILKTTLFIACLYYLIGAVVHYFWLTLFPWFEASLYSPYHDSIIAMASLAISGFFFVTFLEPKKYIGNIYVIILSAFINGFLTLWMSHEVDFMSIYGNDLKISQAYTEGFLLLLLGATLCILKPKN